MSSFRSLLHHYRFALVYVVGFGVIASLLEGISIALFIPLLQNLGGTARDSGGIGFLPEWIGNLVDERQVPTIVALMLLCIFLKQVVAYTSASAFALTNLRVGHRLRLEVMDQLLAVSPRYVANRPSGELINTLAGETWRTTAALSELAGFIASACTVVIFTVLLFLISPELTLAVMLGSAITALAVRLVTTRLRALSQEAVRASQNLTIAMWEGLLGAAVIRAFDDGGQFRARFAAFSEETRRVFLRMELVGNLSTPIFEMASAVLLLTLFTAVLMSDRYPVPVLVAYSLLLYRLQPQLRNLINGWVSVQGKAGAVRDVLGFVDRSDKPYLAEGAVPFRGLEREVAFHQVVYFHDREAPATLHGVSLTIRRGSFTGIVGLSGAGKSTVVELLCRNDDPSSGEILVDGVPLPELRLADWRGQIGVVSQDIFLFGSSVRENISFGRPGASLAEITEAARRAQAEEFILQLPQGYETLLGDRGMRLSGGQRQRIALARAILRRPDILILDEATNALDVQSERLISDALKEFGAGRTIVAIAHRLTTVEDADHVVVLDAGRVVEEGKPAELRAMGAVFATLHQLQSHSWQLAQSWAVSAS
jgi:subfamily B ATP-binding cassette protein MsbA